MGLMKVISMFSQVDKAPVPPIGGQFWSHRLHMEVDDGNASSNAASTLLFLQEEGPGVVLGHDGLCNR